MSKIIVRLVLILVGAHLLLGLILIAVEAIHGVNDQDASFAVALLFHYLNWPSVYLLNSPGAALSTVPILLVGILQWIGVALVIAVVYRVFKTIILSISRQREEGSDRVVGNGGQTGDRY